MPIWLSVGLGGALGLLARHGVNVAFARVGRAVPYATAAVNIAGCLAIGVLAGLVASGTVRMSEPVRAFVFVGVLGGFTTFSSFALDTLTLTRTGAAGVAFLNVAGQVVAGLAAAFIGYRLAKGN